MRDFDLLAVLLHALTLSFEALVVGGVSFLLLASGVSVNDSEVEGVRQASFRLLRWCALGMALAEILSMAVSAAMLTGDSGSPLRDLLSAAFLRAEGISVLVSVVIALFAYRRLPALLLAPPALLLMASTVWLSHAVSRMDHRLLLAGLTGLHHLGTAAWIGAMPYLLISLRSSRNAQVSERLVRRFSMMAMASVAVLVGAGVGMSWYYVGSMAGLYGTSYGLMLLAKIYLLVLLLTLGGANWYLLRTSSSLPMSLLMRLRRFSEVEIGLGFTVLLAAASLTAQAPAVDVTRDRVTGSELRQRLEPRWPRLESPPLAALVVPTPMGQAIQDQQFNGVSPSDANDMAWSEYNHHWAGLLVLVAGALALCSRSRHMRWARYWPLAFLGLAVFIMLRADPEAWPLGPRPFWASFSSPDVLEHRFYALLIAGFAAIECVVQTGGLRATWAGLIFPGMCALGGAMLLTHSHGLGDMKEEMLIGVSHTLIALLGVTAGWCRWLELRLEPGRAKRIAGLVWPVALLLVAAVLLDYREA